MAHLSLEGGSIEPNSALQASKWLCTLGAAPSLSGETTALPQSHDHSGVPELAHSSSIRH